MLKILAQNATEENKPQPVLTTLRNVKLGGLEVPDAFEVEERADRNLHDWQNNVEKKINYVKSNYEGIITVFKTLERENITPFERN